MFKPYEKEYCLKCYQPHPSSRDTCKCGSRNFVFGEKFSLQDGQITCDCGNDEFDKQDQLKFNRSLHIVYSCTQCNNIIGIEVCSSNV